MSIEPLESMYPIVMGDVAQRILAAEQSCNEVISSPEHHLNWKNCEFIALQLRKICELFVLGSTLAHLGEGGAKFDNRKWRPKEAFGELANLNEYPLQVPIELNLNSQENGQHQVLPISKAMPFALLNAVYGLCGDALHIPSAKKVLEQKIPPFDVPSYQAWMSGFKRLLQGHALMLPELKIILLCTWSTLPDQPPEVFMLNALGESTVDWSNYSEFSLLAP